MMNFFFDQNMTIQSISAMGQGQLDRVFQFIIENINGMDKDFEIKRLIIGLSTLAISPTNEASINGRIQEFMRAIVYLCQKSIEIKEKRFRPIEEAQEDKECEKGAIYLDDEDADDEIKFDEIDDDDDDDDQWSCGSEDDFDLYDSKFDKFDEILHLKSLLESL